MRLIDADKLLENIGNSYLTKAERRLFSIKIRHAPTVTKSLQGEWYYNCQNGWHCSICHEPVKDMPTVMGKANFAFCPNCGADMRAGG